ncbi:uncharacterized protein LOC120359053 [Solenopsis invicta]|nr:uncharacterized protein LOC120359053 [Solenopsis invicta]
MLSRAGNLCCCQVVKFHFRQTITASLLERSTEISNRRIFTEFLPGSFKRNRCLYKGHLSRALRSRIPSKTGKRQGRVTQCQTEVLVTYFEQHSHVANSFHNTPCFT